MSSINRFPFKYKNWYYWLVFTANVGVSAALLFFWKFNEVIAMKFVSVSLVFLFLIFLIIYLLKTFKEHKACISVFRNSHNYISKLLIGIGTSFASINVGFIVCAISIFKSTIDNSIYTLVGAILAGLLGVVSNIFINWFEFKIQFEFFYRKYKDTVFREVSISINERKRQLSERKSKKQYSSY